MALPLSQATTLTGQLLLVRYLICRPFLYDCMNGFAPEYWMHKKNLVAMDLNHSLACLMVAGKEIFFERWKIISTMHKSEGLLFDISLSFFAGCLSCYGSVFVFCEVY